MNHSHWCWRGKHFIHNCDCKVPMPVNIGCQACIDREDKAKDDKIQEALDKIIDVDIKLLKETANKIYLWEKNFKSSLTIKVNKRHKKVNKQP